MGEPVEVLEYLRDTRIDVDEDLSFYWGNDDGINVIVDRYESVPLGDADIRKLLEWLLVAAKRRGITTRYEVHFREPYQH